MNALFQTIQRMDWQILSAIQEMQSPLADGLLSAITRLGDAGAIWILLAVVLLLIPKTRRCGIAMTLALLLVLLLGNCLLKPWIARLRPFMLNPDITLLIPPPTDGSFPSGHTYTGIAAATVLWHHDKRLGIPAMILAVLIAFSRLYLQVHFPSDILGGILLGLLCAEMSILLVYKKKANAKGHSM